MITQIKSIGTSKGIILPKYFLQFHGFKEGDWVNIEDIVKVHKNDSLEAGSTLDPNISIVPGFITVPRFIENADDARTRAENNARTLTQTEYYQLA